MRCAERWIAARVLCSAKDTERSFLFDRTNIFQPRTHRAHCAATAKREIQRNKSAAVHPLYTRAIDAQQKNTLRTAHLPSPAPARSAVKRTGSMTTGHPYDVLTTCAAREEERLPASLLQKPSFSSPPCTALFFFSAHGEKEEGGAFPTKESVFSNKENPSSQRDTFAKAYLRQSAGSILWDRKPALPIKGAHSPPECETPSPAAAAPVDHPRNR